MSVNTDPIDMINIPTMQFLCIFEIFPIYSYDSVTKPRGKRFDGMIYMIFFSRGQMSVGESMCGIDDLGAMFPIVSCSQSN